MDHPDEVGGGGAPRSAPPSGEPYAEMSYEELVEEIFRHEKEVRGIDWREIAARGPDGIAEGRRQAHAYVEKLRADLGAAADGIPELGALLAGDPVKQMPAWGIDEREAEEWRHASGEHLGKMVASRLRVMQSLELARDETSYADVGLGIGVIAWSRRAYDLYRVARLAGAARAAAVVQGIRGVTLAATRAFVAGVVVTIIAEVLLALMEKKAVVYTVLVNMTDDDLGMQGITCVNGKQLVQFVDPVGGAQGYVLTRRVRLDIGGVVESNYWVGLFSASKRQMALIGSLGSFSFAPTATFPNGAYVGWEIPLTRLFGGPNRCLVSAQKEGGTAAFAKRTGATGSLFSSSVAGRGRVTGRMHSGQGSEGYMSVIFEQG